MRRGDVWLTDYSGAVGSEIQKTRPSVVVSTDVTNATFRTAQVVPLSTRSGRRRLSEAHVPSMSRNGRISRSLAHQVRTVDRVRLLRYLGEVTGEELTAIEETLRWQLGL